MFFKIDVLKNFWNIHKKIPVLESKLQAGRPATLLEKRLQQKCFPMSIEKFLKAAFL